MITKIRGWELEQVNIFVGKNGSGKTTLLKEIYNQHKDNFKICFIDTLELEQVELQTKHPIVTQFVEEKEYYSQGELRLIYIFSKIILERPEIVVIDNPEISLHINWQETLIDNILKINPNAQLIIATHSPDLIINGWQDKVIVLDGV